MPVEIFKKIASIPRPSGKEHQIVAFIKEFAKQNKLHCEVDAFKNILIKKQTSNTKCLILQAHTDMVCVSTNKNFNFETQPIKLIEKDGFLKGNGTSLGADNGVGVALALKILQEGFPMNLEVLFTTEEETTMAGALNFDVSKLSGKHLLSLDGSSKATIDISSASSTNVEIVFEKNKVAFNPAQNSESKIYQLEISGLKGGHSGIDVDKNLGNAFKIMVDFLTQP